VNSSNRASKAALLFVLIFFGGSFIWWFRNRPSFLIYQAHSQLGKENQAAVIARYEKLIAQGHFEKKEEIKLRLTLGEFYLNASGEFGTVILRGERRPYNIEHPFITKAKVEFDRILELDPNYARAHFYVGRVLLFKRLEKYAIDELKLALNYDPKLIEALYWLSLIHLDREKPEQARDFALQALAIKPDYDAARWALVQSYTALGEPEKALRVYNNLSPSFKQSPRVRSFFALTLAEENQWDRAQYEIQAALKLDPDNHWVRVNHAQILIKQGNVESAMGELIHAEKIYKNSPWPKYWLAKVNSIRGDCYRSEQTSQLLVEVLPRWPSSHLAQAWTFLCFGKEKEARLELQESLRLAPKFAEARRLLAEIFLDKGDYEQLGTVLRPWLDEKRYQSEAYCQLARSLYQQKKWELATEMSEIAIGYNTNNPWPYLWIGLIRLSSNHTDSAERAFNNALRRHEYSKDILGYYAYYKSQTNRFVEARSEINQLISKDPRNPKLWSLKGYMQVNNEHYEDALQSFQQALVFKPYLLEAHLGMVESYWNKGDQESAMRSFRKAFDVNSKNKEVLAWRKKIQKKS